jgi:hypothetical protein
MVAQMEVPCGSSVGGDERTAHWGLHLLPDTVSSECVFAVHSSGAHSTLDFLVCEMQGFFSLHARCCLVDALIPFSLMFLSPFQHENCFVGRAWHTERRDRVTQERVGFPCHFCQCSPRPHRPRQMCCPDRWWRNCWRAVAGSLVISVLDHA